MPQHHEIASALSLAQSRIVRKVSDALLPSYFWREQIAAGRPEALLYEASNALVVLRRALRHRAPLIWQSHLQWLCGRLQQLGGSRGRVHELVAHIWAASAAEVATAHLPALHGYIQSGLQALASRAASVAGLHAEQHALSEALVAATFDTDWQWQRAYATDGRAAACTDAWFAIDALKDALEADELVVPTVEGLRRTLRSRKLTSMHARQWYWLLEQAAQQRCDAATLRQLEPVLKRAQQALIYSDTTYQVLLRAQEAIVADAAAGLLALRFAPSPAVAAETVGWLLAYLGESLVQGQAEPLHQYLQAWSARAITDQAEQIALGEVVAVLHGAIERRLPATVARRAAALLAPLRVGETLLAATVDT
jgi:hypothetical protein